MTDAWVSAAVRTPVANRDGALAHRQAWQLASPLVRTLLHSTGVEPSAVDQVLMGNALYGGGNPARLAALDAGLPVGVPALTLDSQCCGGLDAIALGAQMIRAGSAHIVIAGGLESWSRAPQRISNPVVGSPKAYDRPPFSPWPARDPDMLVAAAELAQERGISRARQQQYAIASHTKARANSGQAGLIPLGEQTSDEYTRTLSERLCQRLPTVAGVEPYALNAATVAPQSDGAALVLLMSDQALQKHPQTQSVCRVLGSNTGGSDPAQPALAPIAVAQALLKRHKLQSNQLHSVHLMEAFAVQAMAFIEDLGLSPEQCNPSGGALSRGHPIGASGAIEAVNTFHALQNSTQPSIALCAIAAAGGLGSAMLLERT